LQVRILPGSPIETAAAQGFLAILACSSAKSLLLSAASCYKQNQSLTAATKDTEQHENSIAPSGFVLADDPVNSREKPFEVAIGTRARGTLRIIMNE
jgi:hypothetical protein